MLGDTHHVVARKELLQELSFLVHHSFDDEFIVAGDIEEGAAGPGVGQLNQRLVTQRVLGREREREMMLSASTQGTLSSTPSRAFSL